MQQAVNFLASVKGDDAVVIVFNNDGDGICSCSLVLRLLEKRLKKKPFIISQPMPMDKNLISKIKTTVPSKIIFLDLPVDQQLSVLNSVKPMCDVLIIDHHKPLKNVSSRGVIHVNPRFRRRDIYQSTSYLAYKICSGVSDMHDALWVAGVGMVSDYDLRDSQDVVGELRRAYGLGEDLYATILGRIADALSSVNATKALACETLVDIVSKASSPDEIVQHAALVQSYRDVEEEMKRIMADFETSAEFRGRAIFYNMKSRLNLRSPFSTKVSELYEDKVVVIYQHAGTRVKASMRNQKGNIDLVALLHDAVRGLDASAGGHERAAGAIVNAKDWDIFKERLCTA